MIVVLGASGHVGKAVVEALHAAGVEERDIRALRGHGANAVDAHDAHALRKAFDGAQRLFLLNPPASPKTDTLSEEKHTVRAIIHAIAETPSLKQVVAESTYGAAPLENAGDLGVLYEMEQALTKLRVTSTILRAAYYMSNWDLQLDAVKSTGRLETFFPADQKLPMVAPRDIGAYAAKLLLGAPAQSGIFPIEGPKPYSSADVAAAFGRALDKTVSMVVTPREEWISKYESLGFSRRAAESYSNMTATVVDGGASSEPKAFHGPTPLDAYIEALVAG